MLPRIYSYLGLVLLLLSTACWAGSKHRVQTPEQTSRDIYARQFEAEIEHDGWYIFARALRPNCSLLCPDPGNHDGLRILVRDGGSVQWVDQFALAVLKPRLKQMRELGFVEIDIINLLHSNSYPNGAVRLPIPNE